MDSTEFNTIGLGVFAIMSMSSAGNGGKGSLLSVKNALEDWKSQSESKQETTMAMYEEAIELEYPGVLTGSEKATVIAELKNLI